MSAGTAEKPLAAGPVQPVDQKVNSLFIIAAILVILIPGNPVQKPEKVMQSVAGFIPKNSKSVEMLCI
jgi:hypothetical protein